MYSRSYNNEHFTVPKQYSGVAFARSRQTDAARQSPPSPRPPVGYSPEVGERLYTPGDLPKVSVPIPREETAPREKPQESTAHPCPSFVSSLRSFGDDTLMLIALILLLSGCEDAGDTVILLILLLVLG